MGKNHKPIAVLASGNSSIISVAESLLKDAGIVYTISKNGLTEIAVKGEENIMKARNILVELEELDFRDNK